MNKLLLAGFFILITVLIGCEKKLEPMAVGEMNEYRDPGYGFKIKYPKEWVQMGATGKAVFAKSQDVVNKFQDPTTGIEGAMVVIEVLPYAGKTPDAIIQSGKEDLKQTWQNVELQPDAQLTIAGKQATNIRYTIPVTSKKKIIGTDLYTPGDTAIYKLSILSFGEEQVTVHTPVFNAMMNSFELPVVVAKKSDIWQPSPSLETFNSQHSTFQYPDNRESVPVSKGNFDFSMKMRADRLDCSIQIDVLGAKGLTVDKVWDQNKGRFKARTKGEATIDGNKAVWVEYSPMANITSRTYFMVKNDKIVRPTITWFSPQRDIYFPAFEKCANSLKLK
jgi:hypothetical protein